MTEFAPLGGVGLGHVIVALLAWFCMGVPALVLGLLTFSHWRSSRCDARKKKHEVLTRAGVA